VRVGGYDWPWLSFEIDGVDMSQYVKVGSASGSNVTGGRNSATYSLLSPGAGTAISDELEHPDVWTDTYTLTGQRLFFTTYYVAGLPTIEVNGVSQLVCAITDTGSTPGWKFYYIPGSPGISHNQDEPLLTSGTIEITYPVSVPTWGGVSASPRYGGASTVTITHVPTDTVIFGGVVDSTESEVFSGLGGFYETRVHAVGYGALLDRRVVAEIFKESDYGTVESIVTELVDRYFASLGVTYDGHSVSPNTVGTIMMNHLRGGDAMRKVCDQAGCDFFIDHDLTLQLISGSSVGLGAAPFAIEQDDGNWSRMVRSDVNARFWNSVVAKSTRTVEPVRRDTLEGDGATTVFELSAAFALLDEVGVEVTVDGDIEDDFTLDRAGITFAVAPADGAEIIVTSVSDIDNAKYAKDEASIAAVGEVQHLREVPDVPEGTSLQGFADAVLQEGLDAAPDLMIYTNRPELKPGHSLVVDANGVDETTLVQSVDWSAASDGGFPRFTAKTSGRPKRQPTTNEVISRILAPRTGVDRIANRIRFRLAETIVGDDNDGVVEGAPQNAFAVAENSGLARRAIIDFPEGTGPVKVDVLKNGVSIFQAGGISWLGSGACYTSLFSAWPLPITIGDRFTLDVITGDATAKDGYLAIEYM